jgi:hypothetical protein
MLLARTDAMLYNRRVIHSNDAGIATASPTMNRDARRRNVESRKHSGRMLLTDVTPYRRLVVGISMPQYRVDE